MDAPWRKAAAERIEKYRKGDLTVTVVDKNGKPVKDAQVSVKMKKNAYAWGTTVSSNYILDTTNPNAKIYRDTLLRYFNKVVFDNEIKSHNWSRYDHAKTLQAIDWLNQHDLPIRGHVMVWPSWTNSRQLIPFKNDTVALRAQIFKEIEEQTTLLKGKLIEWDVINEPYANHDVMDLLGGKKMMVDWFNAARKNTEGVKLFLNEYTMFLDQKASDDFYNNIKYLKDNHAPIEAIGEQGHIGGNPPGIELIIDRLNHFAEFGLPIQISEFDITSDDDDFKARYLRDFFTAVYSHPATIGILQWGFWAPAHWIAAAALWDKDWNIRPEGKMFTELVSKTWSTDTAGTTAKNGEFKIRGFNGDYEITVNYKGKSNTQKYTLDNKGGHVIIKLL
jgi:GH35 family endo-1,4-beta-xylanase